MRKRRRVACVAVFIFAAGVSFAADLSIDMQVNTVAKDYANNYLTFKGLVSSVEKDQFAPGADAVSGASRLNSTELFNVYRFDVEGKPTLPGALRSLLLFAVANDSVRTADALSVSKAASGIITVRYINRGTAYEIVTDIAGKIVLPTTTVKLRRIGHTDNTIASDFSRTGKASDVDWDRVWDTTIADGKVVGKTTTKTGPVAADVATSEIFVWTGVFQLRFDGKLLRVTAALDARKN